MCACDIEMEMLVCIIVWRVYRNIPASNVAPTGKLSTGKSFVERLENLFTTRNMVLHTEKDKKDLG